MMQFPSFSGAMHATERLVRDQSRIIHSERWQGVSVSNKPEMAMHVVLDHSFKVRNPSEDPLDAAMQIHPNLPWADEHFLERVNGQPLNPGQTWTSWPWGNSANAFRDDDGQFNHNYMERYWPRLAAKTDQGELLGTKYDPQYWVERNAESDDAFAAVRQHTMEDEHQGLRHRYGDLRDLVDLLVKEPTTRQAYLPIWFPEDTGSVHNGRKPCTLGYLFDVIDCEFNVTYYIRSCDFRRHFRDDVYLTWRLLLWILNECRRQSDAWRTVHPGTFTMHIRNLHVFRNDYLQMFKKLPPS